MRGYLRTEPGCGGGYVAWLIDDGERNWTVGVAGFGARIMEAGRCTEGPSGGE